MVKKDDFIKFIFPLWRKSILPITFAVINAGTILALPLFPKYLIDNILKKRNFSFFSPVILSFVITIIIYLITSYFKDYLFFKFQRENILFIQRKLVKKLLYADFESLIKMHSGYLSQRIRGDVGGLSNVFSESLFSSIIKIFQTLGAFLIIFKMDWRLSILSFFPVPVIFLIIKKYKNELRELAEELLEKSAKASEILTDSIGAIELIKSEGKEEIPETNISKSFSSFQKSQILKYKKESQYNHLLLGNLKLLEILVWGLGTYLVILKQISIGTLVAFISYLTNIYEPFMGLGNISLIYEYGKKSLLRIKELWEIVPEEGKLDPGELKEIEVRNLSFWFDDNNLKIFSNINIKLKSGSKLLLVGSSGKGKSTFIRNILGLYRCKEGNVFWNNIPINKINKKKLRKNIGYVSQDILLYKETVYNNLTMGENIDKETIKNILNKCGLNSKFDLNYKINERGSNLSGGERQRMALARALLKNPNVIILDEATSNIDKKTKNEIERIILKEFRNKILIKISHNHSEIEGWDILRF